MASTTENIWDTAKQHASKQTEAVKKRSRRQKSDSILSGPMAILKLGLILMSLYALAKYVPAYVNVNRILTEAASETQFQPGAQNLADQQEKWGPFAPLREYAKLKKAYVRAGQSLQVQYILPKDAQASLTLKRCKNILFLDAFKCIVVQSDTIDISGEMVGTRRLRVSDSAMYILESHVLANSNERVDIVWRRT